MLRVQMRLFKESRGLLARYVHLHLMDGWSKSGEVEVGPPPSPRAAAGYALTAPDEGPSEPQPEPDDLAQSVLSGLRSVKRAAWDAVRGVLPGPRGAASRPAVPDAPLESTWEQDEATLDRLAADEFKRILDRLDIRTDGVTERERLISILRRKVPEGGPWTSGLRAAGHVVPIHQVKVDGASKSELGKSEFWAIQIEAPEAIPGDGGANERSAPPLLFILDLAATTTVISEQAAALLNLRELPPPLATEEDGETLSEISHSFRSVRQVRALTPPPPLLPPPLRLLASLSSTLISP